MPSTYLMPRRAPGAAGWDEVPLHPGPDQRVLVNIPDAELVGKDSLPHTIWHVSVCDYAI